MCITKINIPFPFADADMKRGKFKTLFPCPQCDSIYDKEASLTRHLKFTCLQPPKFLCPHCKQRSKTTSGIYGHIRRMHPECKIYAMDIYGGTIKASRNFSGEVPRFKCPYCDYICKVKGDIRKHIFRVHKGHDVYVINLSQKS